MIFDAEYEPSPWEPVAQQVADYERTNGEEGSEFMGGTCIILTTIGAKSRKVRKTPLIRVTKDGNYVAIGSMGGAPDHPQWVHNLRVTPKAKVQDMATVKEYAVEELTGDDKATWWKTATAVWPDYDEYQASTDRVIPLFLLTPVS